MPYVDVEKRKIYQFNYRLKNKDKARNYHLNYYRKNKTNIKKMAYAEKRDYFYQWNYGISLIEYDRLYQIQCGRCAICLKHQLNLKKRLCVDHDHNNGKVRGLLCDECNLMLGKVEKKLGKVIQYLAIKLGSLN